MQAHREGPLAQRAPHGPHPGDDAQHALPHVLRCHRLLPAQASCSITPAQGPQDCQAHHDAHRTDDHREGVQGQRAPHHTEEPCALMDERAHERTDVQDYRHEAQEDLRRTHVVLRYRRCQARPRGRALPPQGRLPLRHQLRNHRK